MVVKSLRTLRISIIYSTCQGKSWCFIKTGSVDGVGLTEPEMVAYSDGRVVIINRADGFKFTAIATTGM